MFYQTFVCTALLPFVGRPETLRKGALQPEPRLAPQHRLVAKHILEARIIARNAWLTTEEAEFGCPFDNHLQRTRYHSELSMETAALLDAVDAIRSGAYRNGL